MAAKKLYRSEDDKIIAGVCGGLGEYLEIDATIVRVVFLVLLFTPFNGGLLYLLLWLLVPSKSDMKMSNEDTVRANVDEMKKAASSAFQKVKQEVQKETDSEE